MAIKAKMDEFLNDIKSVTSMPLFTLSPAKKVKDDGEGKKDEKMKTRFLEAFNNIRYDFGKSALKKDIPIWILGVCHHARAGPEQMFELEEDDMPVFDTALAKRVFTDLASRPWFTYRKNFPPITGTDITSDTGWGCMLRSAQMMVAQGLIIHFLGRDWRWPRQQKSFEKSLHRMILGWFIDDPGEHCPLSIHHLSEIGRVYGNIPGNWYGPNTVSYIMREAVERAKEKVYELRDIVVYVAQDCTIYSEDVYDLCGWRNTTTFDGESESPKLPQYTRSESPTTSTSSECYVDEVASEAWENQSYFVPSTLNEDPISTRSIANNMIPMAEFINTGSGFEESWTNAPTGYFPVENPAKITTTTTKVVGNDITQPQTNTGDDTPTGHGVSADPEPWVKIPSRNSSQKSTLNGVPTDNFSGEPEDSMVYFDDSAPPPNSGTNTSNCPQLDKVRLYDEGLNGTRQTAQHVKPKKSKISLVFEGLVARPPRTGKPRPKKNSKQAGRELKDFKRTSTDNTKMKHSQITARVLPQTSKHTSRYSDANNQPPRKFQHDLLLRTAPVGTDSQNELFLSSYIEKSVPEDSDKLSLTEKSSQNLTDYSFKIEAENLPSENSTDTMPEPVTTFTPISNSLEQNDSFLNSRIVSDGQLATSEVTANDNNFLCRVESNQPQSGTNISSEAVTNENITCVQAKSNIEASTIVKDISASTIGTSLSFGKSGKCSQDSDLTQCSKLPLDEMSLPHCEGSHGNNLKTDCESSTLLDDSLLAGDKILIDGTLKPLSHVDNDAHTPPTVSRNSSSTSRRCSSTLGDVRVPEEDRNPLRNSMDDPPEEAELSTKAALILVPVRLGESALNPIYAPCITNLMTLESSIGIMGGKPKHSLYFVGYQDENLVHLDPHYCQTADTPTGYKKNLHNYHTMSVRKINVKKIDPSCCLGFYCRNAKEFEKFKREGSKSFSPPQQPVSYPMCLILDGRSGDHHIHSPLEKKSSTEINTVTNTHLPNATAVEENSSDVAFEPTSPLPGMNFSLESKNPAPKRLKKSKNEGFSIDDVGSKLNKLNPFPMLMRQKSSSPLSRRKKSTKEESLESQFELL